MEKISMDRKTGIRLLNSLFIVFMIYNYYFIFLNSFDFIANAIEAYTSFENDFINALFFLSAYFLTFIFLSYESLTEENNSVFSKAFNSVKPIAYMQEKFGIDEKKAKYVWFKNFNTFPNKPLTISRGFACRFVYSILMTLRLFIYVSLFTMVVEFIVRGSINNFELKVVSIVITTILGNIIYYKNNPSINNPTGVWKKFIEINQIHISWIDANEEVIKKGITQASIIQLVYGKNL